MNKTILEFIISAVIASKDDQKTLGEEIRQLEETIGSIISTAIKNNPDSSKALYKDYPEDIAYMVQNGQQLSIKNIDKIITSNDTASIA